MDIMNTSFLKTKAFSPLRITSMAGPILLLLSCAVHSAPGDISQSPLFLQNSAQPNIMLLLDDSHSMDKEVLLRGASDCRGGYCYLDFDPDNSERQLLLCPGSNPLMFSPDKKYTPWFGNDSHNRPYQNADVRAAQENPFLAHEDEECEAGTGSSSYANEGVCDLTHEMGPDNDGAYYYPWIDDNNNNQYDDGECKIEDNDRRWVHDMDKETQQNFANWFSYYRKREYVMKRVLSEMISKSQERMGMATLNRSGLGPEDVGVEVKDMDNLSLPVSSIATENKQQLLNNLFRVDSLLDNDDNLRQALVNVGRYFEMGSAAGDALFGFTPASSPILSAGNGGECQQNITITLSDGDYDLGSLSGFTDAHADRNAGQSYADPYRNTLADIAMHYYAKDLDIDLPNRVPSTSTLPAGSRDDNPAQHLVTYTVAFGLSGSVPMNGTTPCYPANREDSVESQGWPNVCSDPDYTGTGSGWPRPHPAWDYNIIDDLLHAAWNGRGQFFSATDPESLIKALNSATTDIATRAEAVTAATAIAVNSSNMQSGGRIYQAGFDTNGWSGQLFAYDFSDNQLSEPVWRAHTQLSQRTTSRSLITFNGISGVPFEFPGNYQNSNPETDSTLHEDQIRDLLTNAPYDFDTTDDNEREANQVFGASLVAYIGGDHSNEGANPGAFRPRGELGNKHRLADIIHSAPVFVGNPDPTIYPDNIEGSDHSYQTWATTTSRTPMVYVGTNGGGLHGFNANTGNEIFAYFPQALFSEATDAGLHWLADQGYTHRYYADQTPSISNAFINDNWRTILVSGLGGGGKAIFAIDITNPGLLTDAALAAEKIKWEFTDSNLGYTYSQPTIAKLHNGQWAAIFGNGYNNAPDGDGRARLYIVNLSDGSLIRSIDTGVGDIADHDCSDMESECNGLSTPAVIDLNGDGVADRAYAGDLAGNLWAFDLSSNSQADWGVAFNGVPLFEATSSPGVAQAITTRPKVTIHPNQRGLNTEPNTMVFFGTGRYLNDDDLSNTATQSFYGVWDNGSNVANDRLNLVQQTIREESLYIRGASYSIRTMSDNPVNYPTDRGWYIDFNTTPKERIIVNPVMFGQLILFSTTIPDQSLCGIAGGSWLMAVDSRNGGEPDITALDINGDGLFTGSDMVEDRNLSGIKSDDLYWQPSIVRTGAGGKGTIFLPKDNESERDGTNRDDLLDRINLRGTLPSKARSSWSHFNR